MKSKKDPRHLRRKKIVQRLFALSFVKGQEKEIADAEIRKMVAKIWQARKKIDPIIAKNAPEWPVEKLNKIDLAILRLAIFELLIEKQEPLKVIIDEAVELAKELGAESSPAFINGVLGAVVKTEIKKAKKGKDGRDS